MPVDAALLDLLGSCAMEHYAELFAEEALTLRLLQGMGHSCKDNLLELGLSDGEASELARLVQKAASEASKPRETELQAFPSWSTGGAVTCVACDDSAGSTPMGPPAREASAPSASSVTAQVADLRDSSPYPRPTSFSIRVADLQAEYFAEDLQPPRGAEAWDDETLVAFFESGGESLPDGSPPSEEGGPWSVTPRWSLGAAETRRQMSVAEQAYERDRQLGHIIESPRPSNAAASAASSSSSSMAAPSSPEQTLLPKTPPKPPPPNGPVVGALPLKWQSYEVDFEYSARTTVSELKAWLQKVTTVPFHRQKLIGWAAKDKKRAEADDTKLCDLSLGGRASKLLMMGTPQVAHASAETDLERGKRLSRFVANDLRGPPPPPKTFGDATEGKPRRTPPAPIHANRGGGIYLDPHVWARTEEEDKAERRARGRGTHVVNRATNRVEALGLENALIAGADGAVGDAMVDLEEARVARHVMEGPINVDLLGTVRGRCRGCTRCDGYVRQDRDADNPNDVAVLNCRRCGCGCQQHEAL